LAEVVGEEPGRAGGNRTMIAITRAGRVALRTWLVTPVVHLRDLRSELLLKLILCDRCGIDDAPLIAAQRAIVDEHVRSNEKSDDVVDVWRRNMAAAAAAFLDEVGSRRTT
jgi:PadR family transcriptional regulator AphA